MPAGDCRTAAVVCGALVLAVAAVFGQTLGFDFVDLDDPEYVYENVELQRGLTADGVLWAFTTTQSGNWHPLTWLSLTADYALYGLNPRGYHLTNVLLHAASAVLLFLVLRRMTGDLWPSAFTAAVFAVHPLHVESVAWVAERKDVLSGLFFMATLAAYAGYAGRPFSFLRYASVIILFALGLMAKPMLVTLPFVLLLLDYWPLRRIAWRSVLEKLPLLALSAASCVVTYLVQGVSLQPLQVPFDLRVQNALVSYAAYMRQSFCPCNLAAFYAYPLGGVPTWKVVGAWLLLVGVTGWAAARRRQCPWAPVGWFWFLGMLVPVIGLVQVGQQAMADRYAYLPQIGLTIVVAWGAKRAAALHPRCAPALAVAGVSAVLALGASAWRQTTHWRDQDALRGRIARCTADDARTGGRPDADPICKEPSSQGSENNRK